MLFHRVTMLWIYLEIWKKFLILFVQAKKEFLYMKKVKKKINPKLPIRRFKRVTTTRWMSHYYALCTVLKTFNALIETLQCIRDTEGPGDRRCGITAGGLLKYFTSEIFLLTAYSFESMFKNFR